MKKLFCSLITLIFIYSISNAQIKVSTAGTVSIGSTSDATEALEVTGDADISGHIDVYSSSIYSISTNNLTSTGSVNADYANIDILQVNNGATFDDDLTIDGNLTVHGDAEMNGTVDATNITSPNFITSDLGFQTTNNDYYTSRVTWDRSSRRIYAEYTNASYPNGYLGSTTNPWASAYVYSFYVNNTYSLSDKE